MERPFSGFPYLLALQNKNEAQLGFTYNNDKVAREIISHITGSYEDELIHHLHEYDYFRVLSDGSTDRTASKKEVVYGRFIRDFHSTVIYLKLMDVKAVRAASILEAVKKHSLRLYLHQINIEQN